eukprot:1158007-Pelagomonas_calceolata.AAC.9
MQTAQCSSHAFAFAVPSVQAAQCVAHQAAECVAALEALMAEKQELQDKVRELSSSARLRWTRSWQRSESCRTRSLIPV